MGTKLNVGRAEMFLRLKQHMYDRAVEVNELRGCYKIFPKQDYKLSFDVERLKDGRLVVNFEWEVDAGCGDYDNEYFSYPAEYLDDKDWIEKERKAIREKKEKAEADIKEKKRLLEEEQKKRDLKELSQLDERKDNLDKRKKELENKYK